MATIAIIGAGMMGTAMCWPLHDNNHEIHLVGTPLDSDIINSLLQDRYHPTLQRRIPKGVIPFHVDQLPTTLDGADWIISGVSSFGVNWFADTVGPYIRQGQSVLGVTKGLQDLENGDLLILPEVIQRRLPTHLHESVSLNAIGGPCIAHELAARRQTSVVIAGKQQPVLNELKNQLGTSYYHISVSTGILGVEICAAMKNAYALGIGLAVGMMEEAGPDGLAQMYNPQAALFGQSMREMGHLLTLLGGNLTNLYGLPGAGDLYVTVFGGRTVRLGKMLGKGIRFLDAQQRLEGLTLESVEITKRVVRALLKLETRGLTKMSKFPLLWHLFEIIEQGKPVSIPWEQFEVSVV
jgi:glycerol-3-phosphate dehydrogenase (NAD(P)+)